MLQKNGKITLKDVGTEFVDSRPHKMSEFYLGGGIPASSTETISAYNLNVQNNGGFIATWGDCRYHPQLNKTSKHGDHLYIHKKASDNGSTGAIKATFQMPKAGTYHVYMDHPSDTSGYADFTLWVDGVKQWYYKQVGSYSAPRYETFNCNAGSTIRIESNMTSPSGWSGSWLMIGADSFNNRTLTVAGNTGVPRSGEIRMSHFYGKFKP